MHDKPILLIGGAGMVGRYVARYLRDAHPEAPLLIGGRDIDKARQVASDIGQAEGVAIDLSAPDLGLGGRALAAMVIFFKDDTLAAQRFAQSRGVPFLSISTGTFEIGPEVSAFIHNPDAAPIVLGAEWLAGAATLPALTLTPKFAQVDEIVIDAVLDEQDIGGPAADIDMHRLTEFAPAALTRRDGVFYWRNGEEAKVRVRAADGEMMDGFGYSPFDIMTLSSLTDAPNVQLNIAVGLSSTRRRGEPLSSEIMIRVTGIGKDGAPLTERLTLIHPEGQAPLTALAVTLMLERLAGLDGAAPPPAGLYFPEQLVAPETFLARLTRIGGHVHQTEIA